MSTEAATLARIRRWLWGGVALVAALYVASVLYGLVFRDRNATSAPTAPVTSSGIARVGGSFSLTEHTGKTVTDADFSTHPKIIYFGWTRDPDLTPAALQVLIAALGRRPQGATPIQPLFITLDPERDLPERLSTYLAAIPSPIAGPTIVGLTGAAPHIKDLAAAYKLYWKRIEDPSLPGGYSIDFASLYYVMGAGGKFVGVVPHTTNTAELAEELAKLVP